MTKMNMEMFCFRCRFICKNCEDVGESNVEVKAICHASGDEADDLYEVLFPDHLPTAADHHCLLSGVEEEVAKFEAELVESVRAKPCQAIPNLYKSTR